MASSKNSSELTPRMVRDLVKAIRKHPSLTDAADAVGMHPQTLRLKMRQGYMGTSPEAATLTKLARAARAKNRSELYGYLKTAAMHDPKWASYLLERSDEDGDMHWSDTVHTEGDQAPVLAELLDQPPPELQRALDDAGYERVRERRLLPAAVVNGELVDE